MKFKHLLLSASIAVLSLLAFNSLHYRSPLFESGIYYGFLNSVLNDRDLNLVNNVPSDISWILTPNFNVPVMHDHGVSFLWLPIGLVGNALDQLTSSKPSSSRGPESYLLFSVLISTFALTGFGLYLLSKIVRPETKLQKILFWFFPLTTPLLYYGFFEFVSADIAAFFWACLVIYAGQTFNFIQKRDSLVWGLLFGLGRVIKISFLFWIPFFLFILLSKSGTKTKTEKAKELAFFSIGSLLPLMLKRINDYVQYGFLNWNNGYGYDFEFPRPPFISSLLSNLFGNYGVFHIGLWLILGLACFYCNVKSFKNDKQKIMVWWFLASTIFLKFLYECLCISDNETEFGFRRYLIDVPFMTWMVVQFCKSPLFQRTSVKFISGFAFVTTSIWAFWYLFWYQDLDQRYYALLGVYRWWQIGDPAKAFLSFLTNTLSALSNGPQLTIAFGVFLACLGFFKWGYKIAKPLGVMAIAPIFTILYIIITSLNVYNNPRNVEKLKIENQLESQVISSSLLTLLYDEILSEISRSILIAKYTQDKPRFDHNVKLLENYLAQIPSTLSRDPVGFADYLKSGRIRKIYYDVEMDMESLMNYDATSHYDRLLGPYQFGTRSKE